MWRKVFAELVLLYFISFFSCSSGIKLQFKQPAQQRLVGIKRLVVAPCKGVEDVALMCNFLTTFLKQTNYFELFDRNKFSVALAQNQLSYEKIKHPDSLSQIGKLVNVDGIIFSELTILEFLPDEQGVEKVEKSVWTGEYERDENGEIIEEISLTGEKIKKKKYKLQTVKQHYRIRKAKIGANFQLIDLQKGSSIVSRELTENYTSDKIIKEEADKIPSDDEIKRILILNIVRKFCDDIAPKTLTVKRFIETGTALIDSGTVHAKAGRWNEAMEFWNQAQKAFPTNARVYYNLGLAHEARGDYKSAEIYYKKATLLNPKKKLYQKAIQKVKKMWLEKKEQGVERKNNG